MFILRLPTTTFVVNGVAWVGEISWYAVSYNTGDTVASGGGYTQNVDSVDVQEVCSPEDCYVLHMYDSFGDGWNGCNIDIYENGSLLEIIQPQVASVLLLVRMILHYSKLEQQLAVQSLDVLIQQL